MHAGRRDACPHHWVGPYPSSVTEQRELVGMVDIGILVVCLHDNAAALQLVNGGLAVLNEEGADAGYIPLVVHLAERCCLGSS